jgi:polyhydroxyalkanoate synthesis regulator phasin
MKDLMKKSFLLGLGITALTKDKIEKELSGYMKKNKIDSKEGKKFTEDLLKDLEKNRKKYVALLKKEAMNFEKTLSEKAKSAEKKIRKKVPKVKKMLKKIPVVKKMKTTVNKMVSQTHNTVIKKTSVRAKKISKNK